MEETLKPEVGDILVCCDVDKDFEDEYCIFLGYDEIGDAIIYSFDLAEVEIFSRKFYAQALTDCNSQHYYWKMI